MGRRKSRKHGQVQVMIKEDEEIDQEIERLDAQAAEYMYDPHENFFERIKDIEEDEEIEVEEVEENMEYGDDYPPLPLAPKISNSQPGKGQNSVHQKASEAKQDIPASKMSTDLQQELKDLNNRYAEKLKKTTELTAERDVLEKKLALESKKQVESQISFRTKIHELETENRKLHAAVKKTVSEKSNLEARMNELESKVYDLQRKADNLSGLSLETLSLEECEMRLVESLEASARIQKMVKRKVEGVVESNKCVVCLVNQRSLVTQPCSHLTLCAECGNKLSSCPICRSPINSRVRVISC